MVALVLDGLVGFPAGLSPTSFHLSPSSFHLSPSSFHLSPRLGACGRVPGWLVSHFLSFVSHFFSPDLSPNSFHLSPRLGACSRVPGWLVSHFLSFVSLFFSFVSQATSFHLSPTSFHTHFLAFLPFPFICLPLLFICLPGRALVVGFLGGLSPTSLHLSPTFSPNSLLLGVLNSFLRRVRPLCHCWCPPISTGHVTFLFIRLPGLSLVVSALFRWSCSISFHLSPRSVTAGDAICLFICLLGLSLAVSALFRCGCNMSIHLFPRSVTANVRPFPLAMQHFCSFVS